MALVDLREIPSSKGGEEGQDLWALFAREFFEAMEITAEGGPDRGPDSGRDLIIIENRIGKLGIGQHRWLVSCKHHAHSDKSVSNSEEPDVLGRARKFKADGFIGFYSTIPSSELHRTLERAKDEITVEIYDRERIERALLGNANLESIFKRFFPKSYERYKQRDVAPKPIGDSCLRIRCNVCNEDLTAKREGRIGLGDRLTKDKKVEVVDMYWACIGDCDRILELSFQKRGLMVSWEAIEDLLIPLVYMHWTITMMNSLREGAYIFSDEAYAKFSEFTFAMGQMVVRETSSEERKRIESLREIPSFLGGLEGWGTKPKYIQE